MSKEFAHFEELMRAYRQSYVIFSAFDLGIFKILGWESHSCNQLVKKTGCNLRGLEMLLTALQAMNLIIKIDNKYLLNPDLTPYFEPSSAQYCAGQIEHEHFLMKRWDHLTDSIHSGQPVKKTDVANTPEIVQRFISAMSHLGQRSAPLVVENIPFVDSEKILDLGGGPGRYLEAILNEFPRTEVTLFDQPETIDTAQNLLRDHPAYDRMNFICGDFFEDNFGNTYDTIFLSNIVHIFGPEKNHDLFKKCADHLVSGGRILIKDMFLNDDGSGPLNTSLFALHMLLSTDSGKCYTFEEMKNLLKRTGFRYSRIYTLTEFSFVIEAKTG